MIGKMFRKLIGIDEAMLGYKHEDEKTWATQLGATLFFAYLFIGTVIFLSLDYLGVTRDVLVLDDGTVTMKEYKSISVMLMIGIFSLLLTSMIVSLDRALILSDWYYQDAYGEKLGFFTKIGRGFLKLKRVIFRLALSIILAYFLSIFLILRIYDGKITNFLKQEYSQSNAPMQTRIIEYQKKVENEIKSKKEELNDKKGQLIGDSAASMWSEDTLLTEYKNEKQEETDALELALKKMTDFKESEAYKTGRVLNKQLSDTKTLRKNEEDGTKSQIIGNKEYVTSGIPLRGKRTKALDAKIESIEMQISRFKATNKDMFEEKVRLEREIKTHRINLVSIKENISKRRDVLTKAYEAQSEQRTKQLRADLKTSTKEYDVMVKDKDRKIETYTRSILNSPEYQQYEDGPIVRYVVLQKLFADEEYGEYRVFFAWLFKAFLVFMELLPVIMKLFFSPPTSYAISLQERLKRKTRDIQKNQCSTIEELEANIALEKKRMEYTDIVSQRKMKEAHNIDAVNNFEKASA